MRLLWAAVAAVLGGTASASSGKIPLEAPLGPPAAHCPPTAAQQVAQRLQRDGQQAKLHLLNDLPPASAYAAVLRRIDGCEAPLIIRYDIEESRGGAKK